VQIINLATGVVDKRLTFPGRVDWRDSALNAGTAVSEGQAASGIWALLNAALIVTRSDGRRHCLQSVLLSRLKSTLLPPSFRQREFHFLDELLPRTLLTDNDLEDRDYSWAR
jgi:hypothetical protein